METHDNKSPDPFNPGALRLDQNFPEMIGVKKLLTTVPVRKPLRHDFVRVHPAPEYRLTPVAIIELKEDQETFLVVPDMARELPGEFTLATIHMAMNRTGVLSLWPVKLPSADGRHNEWHRSAAEAAELATTQWIRIRANVSLGAYEIFRAVSDLTDPNWPDLPFAEILKIAFRDHIVDREDHPLVKRLRGAA